MDDPIRKHDGKVLLYRRNGLYQARIHLGKNDYIHRSLKTANAAEAGRLAEDLLRKELAAYLKTMPGRAIDQPLFMTQKQSGFTANVLCQTLNGLYKHVGMDGATSHSGRRSFITTLASKGIGVRVLASLAGHSAITSTQAYIDVNDAMKRAAVELA